MKSVQPKPVIDTVKPLSQDTPEMMLKRLFVVAEIIVRSSVLPREKRPKTQK
jgi:hypothetical protein